MKIFSSALSYINNHLYPTQVETKPSRIFSNIAQRPLGISCGEFLANIAISDTLHACTLRSIPVRKKENEITFCFQDQEVIFQNEQVMHKWLSEKYPRTQIWEMIDREGRISYKLKRFEGFGFDSFASKEKLYDAISEAYGHLWKINDIEGHQTLYIRYKARSYIDLQLERSSTNDAEHEQRDNHKNYSGQQFAKSH